MFHLYTASVRQQCKEHPRMFGKYYIFVQKYNSLSSTIGSGQTFNVVIIK